MKRLTTATGLLIALLGGLSNAYASNAYDQWKDARFNDPKPVALKKIQPLNNPYQTTTTRQTKTQEQKNIKLVQNMFHDVAEKMNINNIDQYCAKNFTLVMHRKQLGLQGFKERRKKLFNTLNGITVKKPYSDIFAKGDKVTARMTVVLTDKKNKKQEMDLMLVAQIKNNKIIRLWEFTEPNWSQS